MSETTQLWNPLTRYRMPILRTAAIRFAIAACVVAGAGIWLPFVATDLATAMAWNKSFVGSLFVDIRHRCRHWQLRKLTYRQATRSM